MNRWVVKEKSLEVCHVLIPCGRRLFGISGQRGKPARFHPFLLMKNLFIHCYLIPYVSNHLPSKFIRATGW